MAGNIRRKELLAKIHIAKKDLGLTDDEYRALLQEQFGVDSAGKLDVPQLAALMNYFVNKGWKPQVRKSQAQTPNVEEKGGRDGSAWVWIPSSDLHYRQKRKVLAMAKDLGWSLEYLNTRIKRQFGPSHIRWLNDQNALQTLIKDMVNRMNSRGLDPYPER